MKFRIIILFIISAFNNSLWSQSIIPNGDFENYIQIPYGISQWGKCESWTNASDPQFFNLPSPTPDYYSTLGELPYTYFGNVTPKSGNNIMGFFGMFDPVLFQGTSIKYYREYLSCNLTEPMTAGDSYSISFWISNGDSLLTNGYKCDGLGVCLTRDVLYQGGAGAIDLEPQLKIEGEVWSMGWKKFEFKFLSDSTYNYFTIGNYNNSSDVSYTSMADSLPPIYHKEAAYYFIDKVEVSHVPIIIDTICYGEYIELVAPEDNSYSWSVKHKPNIVISEEQNITVSPTETTSYILNGEFNIIEREIVIEECPELEMPNVFTPNNDLINDVFVPTHMKNIISSNLIIVNRWGDVVFKSKNLMEGWNGESNGYESNDGVYFWKLQYEGVLGSKFESIGEVTLIR